MSLKDFLGPTILERDEVLAKKLSAEDKLLLDSPLSLDELNLSIEKSNKKSAPGPDG